MRRVQICWRCDLETTMLLMFLSTADMKLVQEIVKIIKFAEGINNKNVKDFKFIRTAGNLCRLRMLRWLALAGDVPVSESTRRAESTMCKFARGHKALCQAFLFSKI